jgi:hypothetical protein
MTKINLQEEERQEINKRENEEVGAFLRHKSEAC